MRGLLLGWVSVVALGAGSFAVAASPHPRDLDPETLISSQEERPSPLRERRETLAKEKPSQEVEKELALTEQQETPLAEGEKREGGLQAQLESAPSSALPSEHGERVGKSEEGTSEVYPFVRTEFKVFDNLQDDLSQDVSEEPYRLRIGDRLVVSIYGEPGTARAVNVDATGTISYLIVGAVPALGKTINELRTEINERMRGTFKYSSVSVTPIEFGGQYYTVLGEVQNPGKKTLFGHTTLLSALAFSGGFRTGAFRSQTIDLADFTHSFLARNGDYVPVDFKALVEEGDMTQDVTVYSGDYIYVPSSLYKEIHILGAVNTPTTIGFINVVTLVEAISQARGLRESASSRMIIIRGALNDPLRIEVDIKRIMKGYEKDFELQPGDIVYVPTRRFESLRNWVKAGVRAFVGSVFNSAGNRTWEHFHPHVGDSDNRVQQVQVINSTP